MSNGRRHRRRAQWRESGPVRDDDELALVIQAAPNVPGYGGGKWAVYGSRCCWWSSDPSNVGELLMSAEDARPGARGMPCCPHCRGVLFQGPLEDFIASARENAHHYGSGGLATFLAAHNAPCHPTWDGYEQSSAQG